MIFGYSQGDIAGELFQNKMTTNGVMTQTQFVAYTAGCYNDCPSFSSVHNPYDDVVYLTVGDGKGSNNYYKIEKSLTITNITLPREIIDVVFLREGDRVHVISLSNLGLNVSGYAIHDWHEDRSQLIEEVQNVTWTIGHSTFARSDSFDRSDTLYAMDPYNSLLIIWRFGDPFRKNITVLHLKVPSEVWAYNIVDLKYSEGTHHLYGLDRNCSVWQVDVQEGTCKQLVSTDWQPQSVLVGGLQMVIDDKMMYFVGYDRANGSYALATVNLEQNSLMQNTLTNAVQDLQWVAMVLIEDDHPEK